VVIRRATVLVLTVAGLAHPLAAQLSQADEAFKRGDYRTARIQYQQVLAHDSSNVPALYRLAILDSWEGRLVRSLERFLVLRHLAPNDGDIMVGEARVLAWAGRTRASEALYDSVLVQWPGRADALAGRARTVAWGGDLNRAERMWRAGLVLHPDEPELLIGLAQTLDWKGQPALAEAYAARARALAPGDRTARDLERSLRAALRPELASGSDGGGDSDGNDFVALNTSYTVPMGSALRGTLRTGWRRATYHDSAGTSYGADARAIAALGRGAVLRAGLGVRRLNPDGGMATMPLTAELGLGVRPARDAAASIGYSRAPFDETALLMRRGIVIDAVDASVDASPSPRWSISGGGGGAWLSDGNRRFSGVVAVLARALPALELGPFVRAMGYRRKGDGYFSPDLFTAFEGRAIFSVRHGRSGLRADGGAGTQQVFRGAAHQLEWHLGFALTRGWGANNQVALVGSVTNSAAAASTTGVRTEGFRYRGLALRFQQGL
jgi:tetratricopeptide (TPR) repeat protein